MARLSLFGGGGGGGGGGTTGPMVVTSGSTSTVPLTVVGILGQTADLFDIKDSTGAVMFGVGPTGNVVIGGSVTAVINEALTGNMTLNGNLTVTGTSTFIGLQTTNVTVNNGLATFNVGANIFGTTNLNGQINANGTLVAGNAIQFTAAGLPTSTLYYMGVNNSNGTLTINVPSGNRFSMLFAGSNLLASDSVGNLVFTPAVGSTGIRTALTITPAANTALTASTESPSFNLNGSTQVWANGTVTLQRYAIIGQLTFSGTSGTSVFTTCIGLDVASPTRGSSSNATNLFAIRAGSTATQNTDNSAAIYAAITVPAHTITFTGTTQVTSQDWSALRLDQVTFTDPSAKTVDSAATLNIVGPPIAGGSVTLTNTYAIRVKAGQSRFDGPVASTSAAVTLGVGATTFVATGSNVIRLTGDAGTNTVATITGGMDGQIMVILFQDALVTITDTGTGAANTIDLVSTCVGAVHKSLTIVFNGTYWEEVARAANT